MLDVIFLLVGVGFFAGAIALTVWADRAEAGPGAEGGR